jgi:DNA-binding NtrC family response regulator
MRSPSEINILIVDDDGATQDALQQMFDAEGWFSRGVPDAREAMAELAHRRWTLVIANVALADADSPLFAMLKELARADADPDAEPNAKSLRALFLVPTATARWAHRILDRERLPYAVKPFHLHDFLEKVSDLLVDVQAIPQPARDVKSIALKERKQKRGGHDRRTGKMFASREDYMMTEEEIAEFERQEEEDRKKRQEEEKKREVF